MESTYDLRCGPASVRERERAQLTKAIRGQVRSKTVGISTATIAEAVGCSMTQARNVLNSLYEAGEVTYTGTTRDVRWYKA